VELVLTEGKNRQVRRMTARVGYPTLRLIRWAVGPWTLAGLESGCYRETDLRPAPPQAPLPRRRVP
jgi:23S rRNA pseudouridine2457 synthase